MRATYPHKSIGNGALRGVGPLLLLLLLVAAAAAPSPLPARPPDRLEPGPDPAWLATWHAESAAGFSIRYPTPDFRSEAHYFGALARDVRARVDPFLPHPIFGEPIIALLPSPAEFVRVTGIAERRSPAAASGQPPIVYLNVDVLRGMARHEQEKTLAHELAHVFLGRHARGRLPLWLEEGIAMSVEGQGANHLGLSWARMVGGLPPLRTLVGSFPSEGPRRSLAYDMSRSVVDYLVATDYPTTGLRGLMADLVDPSRGGALIERYGTALILDGIEREWLATYSLRVAALMVLTNETIQWVFMAAFAAVCYVVIIVRRRRRMREMDRGDAGPRAPSIYPEGAALPGLWRDAAAAAAAAPPEEAPPEMASPDRPGGAEPPTPRPPTAPPPAV